MHVPDGFFTAPTALAAGGVAAGGVWIGLRRAGAELDERRVPLAGLVAAFVFAAQMVNFPVLPGVSGHFIGGTLAAVLVGPWAAVLVVAVVLVVQALFFADGGLSALGVNIVLLGIVCGLGGYLVFAALRRLLPARRAALVAASGIAAGLSVVAAAAVFTALFAVGGTVDIAVGRALVAMVGVHLVIGIGEGVITALTVSAVMSSRPDLVHGGRDLVGVPAVLPLEGAR